MLTNNLPQFYYYVFIKSRVNLSKPDQLILASRRFTDYSEAETFRAFTQKREDSKKKHCRRKAIIGMLPLEF